MPKVREMEEKNCKNEEEKKPKKNYFEKKNWIFLAYVTPRPPLSVHKKFSPNGPAVWPAIGNIYTNVLFYYVYID